MEDAWKSSSVDEGKVRMFARLAQTLVFGFWVWAAGPVRLGGWGAACISRQLDHHQGTTGMEKVCTLGRYWMEAHKSTSIRSAFNSHLQADPREFL